MKRYHLLLDFSFLNPIILSTNKLIKSLLFIIIMAEEQIQNLDQNQIDQLKENIIKQIKESPNFSQEQKEQFIEKIHSLDNKGFIEFLKKQGIIKDDTGSEKKSQEAPLSQSVQENPEQNCVFCSIVFGDIPSRKIAENEKAIAV